jgi:hypothetical protein
MAFSLLSKDTPLAGIFKLTKEERVELEGDDPVRFFGRKAKKLGYKIAVAASPDLDLFVWMKRQRGDWLLLEDPDWFENVYAFKKL